MTRRRGLRPGSNPGGARKAQKTQDEIERIKRLWAETSICYILHKKYLKTKDPWYLEQIKKIEGDP
jgi:hypothetical protein